MELGMGWMRQDGCTWEPLQPRRPLQSQRASTLGAACWGGDALGKGLHLTPDPGVREKVALGTPPSHQKQFLCCHWRECWGPQG